MTTPTPDDDQIPAADQRRLAVLLLAAFDNDPAACARVEAEIEGTEGGWKGAFAALAGVYVNLMCLTYGEDITRRTLAMTALDASLHEDQGR